MHRFVAGVCRMELTLTPDGPWMVMNRGEEKSNHTDILKIGGRLLFPASSLKGVLRSTAERILQSIHPNRPNSLAPLGYAPFVRENKVELKGIPRNQVADSELLDWYETNGLDQKELAPEKVYALISAISQLFGATIHAGLITLDDAQVAAPPQDRVHVAIDRLTGGVGQGPFTESVAPANRPLTTQLAISNFALWHIGLLALVFQEISRGYTGFGAGTRKGLGKFTIDTSKIEFSYVDSVYRPIYKELPGVVSAQGLLAARYGKDSDVPESVIATEGPSHDGKLRRSLSGGHVAKSSNWRAEGRTTMIVENPDVQQFYRDAVIQAWRPWVEYCRGES